jgi:hypothetical protein
MQDRTIDNALRALCKAGGEQAGLARQLLAMRGVEPPRLVTRCSDPFRRNHMRAAILEALRDGPKTGPEIVRHVMHYRDGWAFKDAQRRVSTALTKMKLAGKVRREGRLWALKDK